MANREHPVPKPFELVAGHVALDLVNTLDNRFSPTGPQELLATYDDLLRFVTQSELLSERQAKKLKRADTSQAVRAQVLAQVRELRETLADIAYAQFDGKEVSATDLAILEERFKEAGSHRRLTPSQTDDQDDDEAHAPLTFAWSFHGLGSQPAAPLWLLAQATADLLLSGQAAHLRYCQSDTCRWLFLDTSKNRTRRWCDMKICGNRMKARRFQARQAAQ
jgi:predicted RNA-binding Zn ribbon-like protein